jgi:hypothetical protein
MSSQFKKAHTTHALAQPAGTSYPAAAGGAGPAAARQDEALRLFAELCERVPDPAERALLLGVTIDLDAAWRAGRQLPLLGARRRSLRAALRSPGADRTGP